MGRGDLRPLRELQLSPSHYESMRAHLDTCLPLEGCGLLAGEGLIVREVIAVHNQAHSAVRFRMDPAEQLRAFDRFESHGLDLLGIFHSHPEGPEEPSPTDIAEAAYQVVYMIWSHATGSWKVRGYWIAGGRLSDVKLVLADIT